MMIFKLIERLASFWFLVNVITQQDWKHLSGGCILYSTPRGRLSKGGCATGRTPGAKTPLIPFQRLAKMEQHLPICFIL